MKNFDVFAFLASDRRVLIGCTVASCYVATSWILSRWPWLLYKPKRLEVKPPLTVAHRGGQAEAPENTLKAFKYAVEECGCDMIELDVWLTKDRKLVVVHDDDLERVTGKRVLVSETGYKDLPDVLASDHLAQTTFEFFRDFKAFPRVYEGQKIPLLEDIFVAFPKALINVDMKGPYDEQAVRDVIALTRKYGRERMTVFAGFMQKKLDFIKTEMPEGLLATGPLRLVLMVLCYHVGLLPFLPVWEDFLEFPISYCYLKQDALQEHAESRHKLPKWMQWLSESKARAKAWLIFKLMCNRGFVSAMKRRGLVVLGWVANTEEEFTDGLDRLGCHGIMTDRPMFLREYLIKRGIESKA